MVSSKKDTSDVANVYDYLDKYVAKYLAKLL